MLFLILKYVVSASIDSYFEFSNVTDSSSRFRSINQPNHLKNIEDYSILHNKQICQAIQMKDQMNFEKNQNDCQDYTNLKNHHIESDTESTLISKNLLINSYLNYKPEQNFALDSKDSSKSIFSSKEDIINLDCTNMNLYEYYSTLYQDSSDTCLKNKVSKNPQYLDTDLSLASNRSMYREICSKKLFKNMRKLKREYNIYFNKSVKSVENLCNLIRSYFCKECIEIDKDEIILSRFNFIIKNLKHYKTFGPLPDSPLKNFDLLIKIQNLLKNRNDNIDILIHRKLDEELITFDTVHSIKRSKFLTICSIKKIISKICVLKTLNQKLEEKIKAIIAIVIKIRNLNFDGQ